MKESFLFAGAGGQGIQVLGQIIAQCANMQGYQVTFDARFDGNMRGSPSNCTVIISDSFIGNPIERHPKNLIAFSQTALEKLSPRLVAGGKVYYDSSQTVITSDLRTDVAYFGIPASALAESTGDIRRTNMIFLGFLCNNIPLFDSEVMKEAIRTVFSKKSDLISNLLQAFEYGSKCEKDFKQQG